MGAFGERLKESRTQIDDGGAGAGVVILTPNEVVAIHRYLVFEAAVIRREDEL